MPHVGINYGDRLSLGKLSKKVGVWVSGERMEGYGVGFEKQLGKDRRCFKIEPILKWVTTTGE